MLDINKGDSSLLLCFYEVFVNLLVDYFKSAN